MGSLAFARDGARPEPLRHPMSAGSRSRAPLRGPRVPLSREAGTSSVSRSSVYESAQNSHETPERVHPVIRSWFASLSSPEKLRVLENVVRNVQGLNETTLQSSQQLDHMAAAMQALLIEYAQAQGICAADVQWMCDPARSEVPAVDAALDSSIEAMMSDASARVSRSIIDSECESNVGERAHADTYELPVCEPRRAPRSKVA
jgi:hypothetical protein